MKDRIRKLRKALDLTQAEFATRLGMKQNTIATYEMGRSTPSDPTLTSIVREFNVDEVWLRTGQGEMFAPVTRNEEIADFAARVIKADDSFMQRFVAMLSQLTDTEWTVLERMARLMAEEKEKD